MIHFSEMRSFIFTLGLAACLAASPLCAQEFLAKDQRDFTQLLPPPPADNSPAGLADLDTLLQLQHDRTPEQAKRAKRVEHQSLFTFGQTVLGDWFTSANLPHTKAIFEELNREEGDIVELAKRTAHRPRPYVRDTRVVPIVELPGNDSYPSGHSANAALWATVLSAAFPEDEPAFENAIRETMWCRELSGVHYPTDTEAGLLLGSAIAKKMLTTPAMGKALADIRAEAAPFLSKQPPGATPRPPEHPDGPAGGAEIKPVPVPSASPIRE